MEAIEGRVTELQNVVVTLVSMLCVMVITYGFSRYEAKVAHAIHSPSLVADAKHIRMDMFANAVVLTGLLSSFSGFNLDRAAAFIIVFFIVWTGGRILTDGIRVLLDASLDYQALSFAEKLILAEPQVHEIQNLIGRNSGRYKFIEADLVVKTHDLDKANVIAHQIESNIKRQISDIIGLFLICLTMNRPNRRSCILVVFLSVVIVNICQVQLDLI